MESDLLVRQRVLDELDFNPSFDAEHIGVAVTDGVVTLSGYVPSYVQQAGIEAAVQRVPGVRAIAMDLTVRLREDHRHDDDEIARRALDVLKWSVGISPDIKLIVEDGKITLRGAVAWNYQREAAERALCRLAGVVGISNNIEVRQKVAPTKVEGRIREAFERNAELDSRGIKVEIDDGKVVLSGVVRAWFERKMAEDTSWSIPGVTTVTNNIAVASVV
jgi:osmotically-inducible protein OsmY